METPKYLTPKEYNKRTGLGVEEIKRQCRIGAIPCKMTKGGYYKIMVFEDEVVPREKYEEVCRKLTEKETTIQLLKNILLTGEVV